MKFLFPWGEAVGWFPLLGFLSGPSLRWRAEQCDVPCTPHVRGDLWPCLGGFKMEVHKCDAEKNSAQAWTVLDRTKVYGINLSSYFVFLSLLRPSVLLSLPRSLREGDLWPRQQLACWAFPWLEFIHLLVHVVMRTLVSPIVLWLAAGERCLRATILGYLYRSGSPVNLGRNGCLFLWSHIFYYSTWWLNVFIPTGFAKSSRYSKRGTCATNVKYLWN